MKLGREDNLLFARIKVLMGRRSPGETFIIRENQNPNRKKSC